MKDLFNKYNLKLNDCQKELFLKYYEFLIKKNTEFNLTAIVEKRDVFIKHFLDSSLLCPSLAAGVQILDVGSGAGFPGIPIKIMRPDVKMTLLDSLKKRVGFLNDTISLLELKNISTIHSRIEDFKNKEAFDFVVSRALSQTVTLLEYLLPFVKVGGYAVLYKSVKFEEEIKSAAHALEVFGGKVEKIERFEIKEDGSLRLLVFVKKEKPTSKNYPRGRNLPKIKPIL